MMALAIRSCVTCGVPVMNPLVAPEDRDRGFVTLADNWYCVLDGEGRVDPDRVELRNVPQENQSVSDACRHPDTPWYTPWITAQDMHDILDWMRR